MRLTIVLATAVTLSACIEAGEPMVSDYNGRTVKVQFHPYPLGSDYKQSPIYVKALETCALDGRSEAVYQGMRRVSEFAGEHVFLCT
jgi:hypothetical protein